MILKKITLENFRSFQNEELTFEKGFQILVGINETGKSNLLRAMSLLDESVEIESDDIRDTSFDEEDIDQALVTFLFEFGKQSKAELIDEIERLVLLKEVNSPLLKKDRKKISLKDYCESIKEVKYEIDLIENERDIKIISDLDGMEVLPNWKKVNKSIKHSFVDEEEKKTYQLSNFSIANTEDFQGLPEANLEDLDTENMKEIFEAAIVDVVQEYLPNTIMWSYTEENLLPWKINFEQFKLKPDTCLPLQNMFYLAGYDDVTESISEAQKKSTGIRNLFNKIADRTTKYLIKVWPEWKDIKVNLQQNGEFIEAGIEDVYNIYRLEKRSDGFKRFFTFLLMISAQNKTNNINNNIIIIDEPDIGLHPSGIKYLRDELKKIGQNNIVIISTHSIFMIDKEEISRHLIVEKHKEKSSAKRVEHSNINDEELIYNALNYSIFEMLKSTNIIFEGWRDRRVFEIYRRSKKGKSVLSNINIENIGFLHAQGVKDIPRVSNTCENFERDYVIFADADKPSLERKKKFEGTGKWITYNDIKNIKSITTEDFISNSLINRVLKKVVGRGMELDEKTDHDKIKSIRKLMSQKKIEKEKIDLYIKKFKEGIVTKLTAKDILDDYNILVERIIEEIGEYQNN